MSITNLKKTFENNLLVYYNLTNEIIIECICFTKLYLTNNKKIFGCLMCDKIKIITIYDIYKNIISEPIQTNLFKDPIKIGDILKNLKKYFFKTFIEAFLINNKLNDIKYNINYYNNSEFIYNFSYDNINIDVYNYFKKFTIYNKKTTIIKYINIHNNLYNIFYYENGNSIIYTIKNYNIGINSKEKLYNQIIYLNKKDLKVFEIIEYYKNIIYEEKRNNNNEITNWKKSNYERIIEEFISNNINPPFSKPLKKCCIEIINNYNKDINYFVNIFKPIFKKLNKVHYDLLLNYNLEMIDF